MSAVTASLCSTLMFVLFVSAGQRFMSHTILRAADQKIITAESEQHVTLTYQAPTKKIKPANQIIKSPQRFMIPKRVAVKRFRRRRILRAADKIITAESGQDVTLTCRAPNNNFISLEWNRADLRDEHVFVYKDSKSHPASQHPSFKNRVDLQDRQMKDGDVSLILKNVTINDAGTYECRVFMRKAYFTETISIIHLHVVPPGQTGGQEKDGDNKDGGKEDKRKEDGSVGLIVGLSVPAVLLGAVVGFLIYRRCNLNPADPHEAHVLERLQPEYQKNITAESGQNVTLTCRAPNNNITAVKWSRADLGDEYVLWYRDELFVPDHQHPSFKNRVDLQDRQMKDGDVSLILKNVTINDAGTYGCRIVPKIRNRMKRDNMNTNPIIIIHLHVVPPELRWLTGNHRGEDGSQCPLIVSQVVK